MIELLVCEESIGEAASDQTRFGGRPCTPYGELDWPTCKACGGNMQFLGQLQCEEGDRTLLLLFMCQNQPGLCDEWDPDSGGNRVILVRAGNLEVTEVPAEGDTVRHTLYGARIEPFDAANYDEARVAWASAAGKSPRQVLGQLKGHPSWIQGDETPTCASCGQRMTLAAQLEQGPDWKTEMNFGGGGCAYVFQCGCFSRTTKFLWQC
jgi:hypothetical protein